MILVLGVKGSGKTTLLNRLQDSASKSTETYSAQLLKTVPTVGTNIIYMSPQGSNSKASTKPHITVQEVGGTVVELWPNYISNTANIGIIFLIDCSDMMLIGEAAIRLIEVAKLMAQLKVHIPLLIAMNKNDALLANSVEDLCEHFLFVNDIRRDLASSFKITVIETSAKCDSGLDLVKNFIYSLH